MIPICGNSTFSSKTVRTIAEESHVVLEVFDIQGQKVKTLVDEIKSGGSHEVVWDGSDDNHERVSSGIYICRIKSNDFSSTRKVLFVK